MHREECADSFSSAYPIAHYCLLVFCSAACFLLPFPSLAIGQSLTLGKIEKTILERRASIQSLLVEYDAKASPLGTLENVKRYFNIILLIDQHRTAAFKDNKLYYHYVGPKQAEPIAPEIEPDWSVIPDGAKIKEGLAKQRAIIEQRAKERAIVGQRRSAPAELDRRAPLRLDPEMTVVSDGEMLYRKYGGNVMGEVRRIEDIPSKRGLFDYDYFGNIGIDVPALVQDGNAKKELVLPRAFRVGSYDIQKELESVDGFNCVVLTYPDHDRLWLDPQLGYAVRRREIRDPDTGVLTCLAQFIKK